uniref:Ion transport domain-containing protein n=1 Tax=Physcomitrium patens TaxID=3218 RepID=A0A7I4BQ85_PHYPA
MRKKVRKKTPLPEIQEEGLLTPLRRGQSAYVQSTSMDFRKFAADLEFGPQSESSLTSHVEMAAALVDQAMLGRWMPLAVVYHKDYESAKRAFLMYHRLSLVRGLIYFILMILPFFEIPAWCDGNLPKPCGDPRKYPLSGLPFIQPWISASIQVLCVSVLIWSCGLQWHFLRSQFWLNRVGVYKVVVLVLMVISTAASSFGLSDLRGINVSMYIRLLVPIVFSRAIRGCFRMTMRIINTFLDIAVLVGTFVLISAWLATAIFSETSVEFKDFSTSLLNLFVLLTTANNPVIWASTYNANRFAFFFFFFYLVLGLYFLMNLAFSLIYSNYKAQMAVEVAKRITARQGNLRAAFSLLDTRHQEWIDGATMIALFLAIGRYRHIPDVRARASRLFLALNKRGDFKIWSDEFEELCDVIAKEVERQPESALLKRRRSNPDMHFVKHPFYNYVIWALTLCSLSFAIAALNVSGTVKELLINLEFLFGWIFVMDGVLKIYGQGWKSYWHTHVNRFDFIVTILILAVQAASLFYVDVRSWVTYLIIARCFRVLALVTMISRWRLMGETLVHVIPATAPILALQFLVCSFFSLLGMHLFGGLIYKDNPALKDTEYERHQFYAFNFNDYAAGMATCFNLCVVNKWTMT